MQLTSERYTVDDIWAAQEFYHSRNWTDGLPIVPPTAEAVQACLDWAMLPPEHLIGIEPVRARSITAEKLAINAVMAGCLPMHFPVVVTAFTAMLQEPFLLHGVRRRRHNRQAVGPVTGVIELLRRHDVIDGVAL